jgi:hypothetical protein
MSKKYEAEYGLEDDDDQESESETITREQVALFESTMPLLRAMDAEFAKLSSKKPETTLSKTKVIFVNRLLTDLRGLLADQPTIKYLDLLGDDDLPQYSDVVLILSQYHAAMTAFKSRYRDPSSDGHRWNLKGDSEMEEDSEDDEDSEDQDDEEDDETSDRT